MKEKALLTDFELANLPVCWTEPPTNLRLKIVAQAQLDKAEPIIRNEERERILNYLKALLKSTPGASLAATIDLIETLKE